MSDLTLHHHLPGHPQDWRSMPTAPCVWCGLPTPLRADTPFRLDLGSLPLMLTCGAMMRDAYRRWNSGLMLEADEQAGMMRLARLPAPQLTAGIK